MNDLFLNTLLRFTPCWDHKPTNAFDADIPIVYTKDEILNINTMNKNHLKTNVIDGSIVNGSRQPILYSFVLDKPSDYKFFVTLRHFIIKKLKNLF